MKSRFKYSVCHWCFTMFGEKWTLDELCRRAVTLGIESVELVEPVDWPTLKRHHLKCAMAPCGEPTMFVKGWNNLAHHARLLECTRKTIDLCAEFGFPNVIAFPGFKWRNAEESTSGEIPPDEAGQNCVTGLKKIAGYAEQKQVTVCIEILNSRVAEAMRGHPGYQGDHVDFCLDIAKRVGSPRVKLLFDVYHVQVMDGDLISHIRQCGEYIGHIHTAGCPGRNELDENQEINYPAVMRALADTGYDGFVGHEFIPTRDPMAGLRQAIEACNV
jgi:sugar phosphate isomerase/epimerase